MAKVADVPDAVGGDRGPTSGQKTADGGPKPRKLGTLGSIAGAPALSFSVPVSSYGVAIMLPILVEKQKTCFTWFHQIGESYLRLAINFGIQWTLTYNLGVLMRDSEAALEDGDCAVLSGSLAVICIWLHVVFVMTDMLETLDLLQIVWVEVPQTEGSSEVLQYEETDEGPSLTEGGMCFVRKILVTALVIFPKFVIAFLILFLGGGYLAASPSNADLLLNSLAVVFIMDVDELIFNFLCPARTRHLIEALPPFEQHHENLFWRLARHWGFVVKGTVASGIVVFIWEMSNRCGVTDKGIF